MGWKLTQDCYEFERRVYYCLNLLGISLREAHCDQVLVPNELSKVKSLRFTGGHTKTQSLNLNLERRNICRCTNSFWFDRWQ